MTIKTLFVLQIYILRQAAYPIHMFLQSAPACLLLNLMSNPNNQILQINLFVFSPLISYIYVSRAVLRVCVLSGTTYLNYVRKIRG